MEIPYDTATTTDLLHSVKTTSGTCGQAIEITVGKEKHLLVNGMIVICNGELETEAFPGRPVRRQQREMMKLPKESVHDSQT